ncbi:MAG: hypothetical protein Q9227_008871 [Pyrenula ochraceoflavens]
MREFMRQRRKERNDGFDPPERSKPEDAAAATELIRKPFRGRARQQKERLPSIERPERKPSIAPPSEIEPESIPRTHDFQGPGFSLELQLAEQKGLIRKGLTTSGNTQCSPGEIDENYLRNASSQFTIPERSSNQSPLGGAQDPLTTSRRDPFQSLPVFIDDEDIPLVDHYVTVVPELMANFNGKMMRSGSAGFNPARDVIMPISLRDPITFQATALAFAAGHLARLHGRKDTPQSVKHRVQSLQRLREHFFGVKKHSQHLDVMVAMLSLSSCEVYYTTA